jgi:cytochrome c oxidase subunit I+III
MTVTAVERNKTFWSPLRLGMVLFLASEAFLFGSLFWTYYYLRALTPGWPPHHPEGALAVLNTVFLLAGSLAVWLGERAIRQGNEKGLLRCLLATAVLGAVFLGITGWEWTHQAFRPWTDAYGSTYYTLTGFHALHVFGGVVLMLALAARTARRRFSTGSSLAVNVGALYWHFVDFIWVLVFITVFIIR